MKHNEKHIVNYISWLEYKKLQHIVRYYPTYNMYLIYRHFAKANNLDCFGGEQHPMRAYASLLEHLRELAKK